MSERSYDPDQKKAMAVNTNAVVAAGAGSGKTTVLAGRFLRLVTEGARVPEILTLTFTRKAAAEMYSRIHRLLADNAGEERVREQLSLFDQARISTLDSFCSRIARNDAAAFGLPLNFSIDQESLKQAADELSLEFILDHQSHPALIELITATGFETVWRDFFSRYAVTELTICDEPGHVAAFARQEDVCRTAVAKAFASLDETYAALGGVDDSKSATVKAARRAAAAWPDTEALIAGEEWEKLMELAARKPYRKPGGNAKDPDLLRLREQLETLLAAAEQALPALAFLSRRELHRGIMELTDEFAQSWRELKQRRGIVSFGDVVAMAVRLLRDDRELRSYYKAQFSHIMIDEFQDNNETQKELLYLLAERSDRCSSGIPGPEELEGEKLFFVGDEKQSIYRFRGADVSVFKRLAAELGGEAIELKTNYRSEPRLIDFFNEFFSRVFSFPEGTAEPPREEFEAEFRPLLGRTGKPGAAQPSIRLCYLQASEEPREEDTETLSAVESEAWEAARLIRRAVEGNSFRVQGEAGPRRPEWNDFALLMRSTGNQIVYERMFRLFGIPYSTENIRTLFLEAPANDIYAALQSALYPEDRVAYAVFLRSFFVNLDDDSLLRELSSGTAPFSSDPEELPGPEAAKYRIGARIHYRLRELIDRVPHRELLRYLWFDAGYRYNLLKKSAYHGYLEFYEYLTALADRSWNAGESTALFLDFLRYNLGDYKKLEEIEVLHDRRDGVRIMTIHKSKGLEFPVVLLASTGQGSGDTGMRAPYYVDEEFGLSVNLALRQGTGKKRSNPFYERARELSARQEEAELKRLLYVAATRAEEHLILLGYQPQKRSAAVPTLLDLIFKGLGTSAETLDSAYITPFFPVAAEAAHRPQREPAAGGSLTGYRAALEGKEFRFPPVLKAVSATRLNAMAADHLEGEGIPLPGLPIDPLIVRHEETFGTMVHRALEVLATRGAADLQSEIMPGVKVPDGKLIGEAAVSLAKRFWNSSVRRGLIPEGVPLVSEAPFSYLLTVGELERVVEGVIDLYADLGDRILVLDFKTNRQRRDGEYAMQMWLYRRALRALTGKPVGSQLVYLREGSSRIEETEFDEETLRRLLAE